MISRNIRSTFFALPLLLCAASASPRVAARRDIGQTPVVTLPSGSTVAAGDPVPITIGLDGTTTSNQVVVLTSSSSALSLPSTVTIPAGKSFVSFQVYSELLPPKSAHLSSTYVTISATCNNVTTYGYLTITY